MHLLLHENAKRKHIKTKTQKEKEDAYIKNEDAEKKKQKCKFLENYVNLTVLLSAKLTWFRVNHVCVLTRNVIMPMGPTHR